MDSFRDSDDYPLGVIGIAGSSCWENLSSTKDVRIKLVKLDSPSSLSDFVRISPCGCLHSATAFRTEFILWPYISVKNLKTDVFNCIRDVVEYCSYNTTKLVKTTIEAFGKCEAEPRRNSCNAINLRSASVRVFGRQVMDLLGPEALTWTCRGDAIARIGSRLLHASRSQWIDADCVRYSKSDFTVSIHLFFGLLLTLLPWT